MFKYLIYIILLVSCQSKLVQKKVDDDLVLRQRSFAEELYLPNITSWANFSEISNCQRESDWNYLNFFEVKKKTGLDFFTILNLQYQLNALWFQKKPFLTSEVQTSYIERLKPSDRLTLFEQALELVNGGVTFWSKPGENYPVWLIDWDKIEPNSRIVFMTSLMALPELKNVIPVILSRCLSSYVIKHTLELQPDLMSFSFVLGAEVMTPYVSADSDQLTYLHHPIDAYFPTGTPMTWVLPITQKNSLRKDKVKIEGKEFKVIYL